MTFLDHLPWREIRWHTHKHFVAYEVPPVMPLKPPIPWTDGRKIYAPSGTVRDIVTLFKAVVAVSTCENRLFSVLTAWHRTTSPSGRTVTQSQDETSTFFLREGREIVPVTPDSPLLDHYRAFVSMAR